jgi:Protein of unknown function (DUF4232)
MTLSPRIARRALAAAAQDLKVSIGGTEGRKGVGYINLMFDNRGNQTCTLYGCPGVSFATGPQGNEQVGQPATELPSPPRTLVTIQPGHQVGAMLELLEEHISNGAPCDPAKADWLKIYPPNQASAVLLPWDGNVCSGSEIDLSVGTIQN